MARVECDCCHEEMGQEHPDHTICAGCGESICGILEGIVERITSESPDWLREPSWWRHLAPVPPPDPTGDPGYCEDCGFPYALVRGPWRNSGIDVIYTDCCSECGTWWCLSPPVFPVDEPTYRLSERCAKMGPIEDVF